MALNPLTASTSADTFHDFPRLPPELRTIIWKLGIHQIRVVEIEKTRANDLGVCDISRFTSKTLVPGMLHACAESRSIALQRYGRIIFDGIFTGSYINWDLDYIGYKPSQTLNTPEEQRCLCNSLLLMPSDDLAKKCRRLVIFAYTPKAPRTYVPLELKCLEEIVILFPADLGSLTQGGGNIRLAPMTDPDANEQIKIFEYTHARTLISLKPFFPELKPLNLMRYSRGPKKRLKSPEDTGGGVLYPDEALLLSKPELPKRVSFKRYRLPELRQAALDLGLSNKGQKKDLIPRLETEEKALFREEMREYQEHMLDYSTKVEKLLREPEKPLLKRFQTHTPTQLKASAKRRNLEDSGSTAELCARLRAYEESMHLEQKKSWELALKDYQKMKARVAKVEFF
ncbi:uncharacterized protein RSE6_10551 [Rhynchosporium secalis]|uniref:SAP domain-containing protein n=1 Tax=Rhynchosporium secalis TaxID=38038 RepID=A0A1E1MKQ8_RHYSE|nr:uncharacterized protein RSE6_10551 [Rhynchosporium secalis]